MIQERKIIEHINVESRANQGLSRGGGHGIAGGATFPICETTEPDEELELNPLLNDEFEHWFGELH